MLSGNFPIDHLTSLCAIKPTKFKELIIARIEIFRFGVQTIDQEGLGVFEDTEHSRNLPKDTKSSGDCHCQFSSCCQVKLLPPSSHHSIAALSSKKRMKVSHRLVS